MVFDPSLIAEFQAIDRNLKDYLYKLRVEFAATGDTAVRAAHDIAAGQKPMIDGAISAGYFGRSLQRLTATLATSAFAAAAWAVKMSETRRAFHDTLSFVSGDITQLQVAFEEVKKLGTGPLFEWKTVNAAAQQLAGVELEASKIPKTLRMVADISAATGAEFKVLAEIIGRTRQLNRADMEDIERLVNRNVPVMKELAAIMNLPQEQVRKALRDGLVSFDVFYEALERLVIQGGKFHGAYDKIGDQLGNRFKETVKSTERAVGDFGAAFGKIVTPSIETALETLNRFLDGMLRGESQIGRWKMAMEDFASGIDLELRKGELTQRVFGEKLAMRDALVKHGLATQQELDSQGLGALLAKIEERKGNKNLPQEIQNGLAELRRLKRELQVLVVEKDVHDFKQRMQKASEAAWKDHIARQEAFDRAILAAKQKVPFVPEVVIRDPSATMYDIFGGLFGFNRLFPAAAAAGKSDLPTKVGKLIDFLSPLVKGAKDPFLPAGKATTFWKDLLTISKAAEKKKDDGAVRAQFEDLISLNRRIQQAAASSPKEEKVAAEVKKVNEKLEKIGGALAGVGGKVAAATDAAAKELGGLLKRLSPPKVK